GMPTIAMQVITPWDTLTGTVACRHCGHGLDLDVDVNLDPEGRESTVPPLGDEAQGSSVPAAAGQSRVVRGQVGQILGSHGRPGVFIIPGQVRELALTPGTT